MEELQQPVTYSRLFVVLCAVAAIWTCAILTFAVLWIFTGVHWAVLLFAVPLTLVTLLVFNCMWNSGRWNMYIIGGLVLCLVLLLFYLFREWQIFLVLLPAEAVVYLACNIPKKGPGENKDKDKV